MQETFYATAAQISFTLLGLWWVIVQFRHPDWIGSSYYRRMAYDVSLYFFLPGIMGLVSLLAADARFLWRATFVVAGLIGLVETILMIATPAGGITRLTPIRIGRWVGLVLYALIAVVAFDTSLPSAVGIGLQPLEVEGLMNALLIFVGVNFAWVLFTEPSAQTPSS